KCQRARNMIPSREMVNPFMRSSFLQPALPFLEHQSLHRLDPCRMIVQARAAIELLAAGVAERLAGLITDFVDGFQAISGEAGCGDEDAFDAAPRQALKRFLGVRL